MTDVRKSWRMIISPSNQISQKPIAKIVPEAQTVRISTVPAPQYGLKTAVAPMRTGSVLDRYPLEVKQLLDDDDLEPAGPHRKRRRLTHLTPDQKNLRRKLKNRVAAQTARDRKKLMFDQLEERVTALEKMNNEILHENAVLRHERQILEDENRMFRKQLGHEQESNIKQEPVTVLDDMPDQLESAEFQLVPQPKEHALASHLMLSQFLAVLRCSPTSTSSSPRFQQAVERLSHKSSMELLDVIHNSSSLRKKLESLWPQNALYRHPNWTRLKI